MKESQKKIVDVAHDCFLENGFTKTSMSLIGEHSGVSRVTVHKYFKNKKALFRCVIAACLDDYRKQTAELTSKINPANPWDEIENYLLSMDRHVFENVKDDDVFQNLSSALQDNALDMLQEKQEITINFIWKEIERGIRENIIDLSQVGIDPHEIATLIEFSFSGVVKKSKLKEIDEHTKGIIKVFRQSTKV